MATYVIGDVQGCFDELQRLLRLIKFNADRDQLWFVGDLVNRGPKSLEVLRFVKQLDNAVVVLGNHDLHLLAIFHNQDPLLKDHTLQQVIQAPDAAELVGWLRQKPLLHHDLGYVMVHAGIYPFWDLVQAKQYAHEIEQVLRSNNYIDFLKHMYGNQPDTWHKDLQGIDRLRFIINSFTRMRFCTKEGKLEFANVGDLINAPEHFMGWFEVPARKTKQDKILFGHWAALQGKIKVPNVYALDTGCIWGSTLSAMCLEDKKIFSVVCGKG